MLGKWERHPQGVGMIVGFILLPLLWILQEAMFQMVEGQRLIALFQMTNIIRGGALPGAILGSGISQAYFAVRRRDYRQAKPCLLLSSILVLLSVWLPLAFELAFSNRRGSSQVGIDGFLIFSIPYWSRVLIQPLFERNLAFAMAFLTLFIGLLMRSRR